MFGQSTPEEVAVGELSSASSLRNTPRARRKATFAKQRNSTGGRNKRADRRGIACCRRAKLALTLTGHVASHFAWSQLQIHRSHRLCNRSCNVCDKNLDPQTFKPATPLQPAHQCRWAASITALRTRNPLLAQHSRQLLHKAEPSKTTQKLFCNDR